MQGGEQGDTIYNKKNEQPPERGFLWLVSDSEAKYTVQSMLHLLMEFLQCFLKIRNIFHELENLQESSP